MTEHVRDLLVDPRHHPRGQAHLSAASALARVQQRLYVVADDEHHLGVWDEDSTATPVARAGEPVTLVRLFDGDLPRGKGHRKAAKPDLEALTAVPPLPGCPHGALLALGSGSRPTRETAVLLALDAQGATTGRLATIDLAGLYDPLRARFADLNIEGAFMASGELHLLQRGNKGDRRSACVRFDWNQVVPWLTGQRSAPPEAKAVQVFELGQLGGVPLGFTDGAALAGGGWVFCAVAEATKDSYHDGACAGSAVGVVGPDGVLRQLVTLHGAPKVEGLAALVQGKALLLSMVTDADDPNIASQLLQARLTLA